MIERNQNIAMAKLAGYRWFKAKYMGPLSLKNDTLTTFVFCRRSDTNMYNGIYNLYNTSSEGDYDKLKNLPDYLNNLDLVIKFEQKYILNDPASLIGPNRKTASTYIIHLQAILNRDLAGFGYCSILQNRVTDTFTGNSFDIVMLMSATAKQRVEAILKTFEKWET